MIDFDNVATYWQLLEKRVAQTPDKTYLIDAATEETLTFAQTLAKAEQAASWLIEQGIGPETVVSWQLPTTVDALILMLALSRVGAIQAPVIHLYRERELGEILRQTQARFLLVAPTEAKRDYQETARLAMATLDEHAPRPKVLIFNLSDTEGASAALPAKPGSGDVVRWYYFTSGTTSKPKGAKHSDRSLMTPGNFYRDVLKLADNDVGNIAYPVAHIGGAVYTSMCMLAGITTVLLARYTADFAITAFRRYGVTLGGGSTAHYQLMLEEQRKQPGEPLIPTMRLLAGGGAAKPAALYYQVRDELGCPIVHAYGMTEAPVCCTNGPDDTDDQLANTDGALMPGLEVRFVDPEGNDVPVGESGEIILRGPNLCQGYLDEEQTTAAFDGDGFYHTGDVGLIRPDGHLCVTGRIKDIIIRKGENISAREVEELLSHHPKVKEVAVIGVPDEERGEMVCAVVELNSDDRPLGFEEMADYLAEQKLMRQKIPERLEIIDKMPRNEALSKVLKNELKIRYSV